jgi:hypothetical protein
MTSPTFSTPKPTPGFEFPKAMADAVDARLTSAFGDHAQPQPLQSVRPERRVIQTDNTTPKTANTVPNVQPAATPTEEAESVSIDLPSRFAFYNFKDLYIRPFRVLHLAKVAKANATGSLQMIAEVVSSVLSTPSGEKNLAFKLTMADFTAVLYWLRFNSFTKKTMQVEFECNNPTHRTKVASGELPASSLDVPDPAHFRIHNGHEYIGLKPETIQDVIEFMDSPQWQDEEFQYLAKLGALLDIPHMSLAQRIDYVSNNLTPDDTVLVQEFAALADAYGVTEHVQLRCPECAASQSVQISVDASRFLSPKF